MKLRLPKISLPWQILIGIALGALYGIFLSKYIGYVSWAGDLFLRALKMIVIPIVFSSIFLGVTGMGGGKELGRIGGKTLLYYLFTTLIAIVIGLILVKIVKPGVGVNIPSAEGIAATAAAGKVSIVEQLTNIIPENLFEDLSQGDLLPIIFFAIVFGIFSMKAAEKHQTTLRSIFEAVYEVTMKLTMFIIKLTPIGVFAIVANMVGKEAADPEKLLGIAQSLGLFVLVVWGGCLIHGLLILPASVRFLGRENPWRHIQKMSVPILTAFTTCSSNAALPLSIRDSHEKCGISSKVAGFVLPLGCTINMNGTALFECVGALFIAQVYGIDLTLGQQITIVITSLLASVGAAGIPMAGMVMMTVVLNVAGLPLEGIGMILAVNQIVEMPRTCTNSYGDMCGAVIIAKSEGETLTI